MPLPVWAMLRTSITLDTYSHAIPAMEEEAAVKIAGLPLTSSEPGPK